LEKLPPDKFDVDVKDPERPDTPPIQTEFSGFSD
jgi:hypothetical protein